MKKGLIISLALTLMILFAILAIKFKNIFYSLLIKNK
mgnify:CR=1 FL=1